ncbi:MAG: hypothetical protein Q8N69_03320 [bacterium]|nr:hypothetical protein [bacterium]
MKEVLIEIIKTIMPLIFGLFFGIYIQKLRNRPQIITHGCRISDKSVYAYFNSDNKPSNPARPYLLENGNCNYPAGVDPIKKQMLSNKNYKCYLAFWDKHVR